MVRVTRLNVHIASGEHRRPKRRLRDPQPVQSFRDTMLGRSVWRRVMFTCDKQTCPSPREPVQRPQGVDPASWR